MEPVILKYDYTEIGYCQVHYTIRNESGQKIHYCLMEEGADFVRLYRTTPDGEADYPVKIAEGAVLNFETPPDEHGKNLLKSWQEETLK